MCHSGAACPGANRTCTFLSPLRATLGGREEDIRRSRVGTKMKEGEVLSTAARWAADLALSFLVAESEGTRLAKLVLRKSEAPGASVQNTP